MTARDLLEVASREVFDTLKHGEGSDPQSIEFERGLLILQAANLLDKPGLLDAEAISLACDVFEWLAKQRPKRAVLKHPEPEITRRTIRIAEALSATVHAEMRGTPGCLRF